MLGPDKPHTELLALIDTFVRGDDRSIAQANAIEFALRDLETVDAETIDDLIVALAMYCPGGGEFLFDETRMTGILTRFRRQLCDDAG